MNHFHSIRQIRTAGFHGFQTIRDLNASGAVAVPTCPGIYVVLREITSPPAFLVRSRGGYYRGKDPTISVEELERAWTRKTPVLYVGKGGGTDIRATLRTRLRCYVSFGRGARVGHWGGRAIWQLADADDLLVAWRPTPGQEPRDVEKALLSDFAEHFGRYPFANQVG